MSAATIIIERLDVGYVVTGGSPQSKRACLSIEDALQAALFWSEGLSEHFGGLSYGKVIVEREPSSPFMTNSLITKGE
jgi:hypothetical protein